MSMEGYFTSIMEVKPYLAKEEDKPVVNCAVDHDLKHIIILYDFRFDPPNYRASTDYVALDDVEISLLSQRNMRHNGISIFGRKVTIVDFCLDKQLLTLPLMKGHFISANDVCLDRLKAFSRKDAIFVKSKPLMERKTEQYHRVFSGYSVEVIRKDP